MRSKISYFLPILFLFFSCKEVQKSSPQQSSKEEVFHPCLIALAVQNIDTSIAWYTKLGFEMEKDIQEFPDYGLKMGFLKLGEFHLEIIESSKSKTQADFLPNPETYPGGAYKIGFSTRNIQGVYDQLKGQDEIEFVTGIGDLPENTLPIKWPSKYFLLRDPDGNFVQVFDGGGEQMLTPWLIMMVVDTLENAISWQVRNLGFRHVETLGTEGNRRAVLARNDYVLELFEPQHVKNPNQVEGDSLVLGFKKIAFGISNIDQMATSFEQQQTEILYPVENSDFDWAEKAMIVKDAAGNWIQVFEVK